jgi:hypothetical protein
MDETQPGQQDTELVVEEENFIPSSVEVSSQIQADENIQETSRHSCKNFQVPITVLLIQCALGICCVLEWGIWNTPEGWRKYYYVKSNAFGAGWFNAGGALLHYLANAILAFFTGWLVEWSVGSLNMVFVWFWGYFFGVGIMAATNNGFLTGGRGWGVSLQLYHWFTIAGRAVFLRFWLFSENRNKQLTFKQILWWIGGIFILLCGGWLANFGI